MAGIDKTYIDGKDYPRYRNWWIANYQKMIYCFGEPVWLYPFAVFDDDVEICPAFLRVNIDDLGYCQGRYDFPVWNTSEREDKWLVKNCDIPSFRERMLSVYPHNWSGFKGQKWIPKPKTKQKMKRRQLIIKY